jgi:tetratricopeptide (TPR) repeat protein
MGRDSELSLLAQWLERAKKGEAIAGFISGEIGIGKSILVDYFLHDAHQNPELWVLEGKCTDGFQKMEPYLPLIDALEDWLDRDHGQRAHDLLRQFAPMWLLQMTGRLGADERAELVKLTQGASQEHRVREIRRVFDVLGETRTVVLRLEDLHWADSSTLSVLRELVRPRRAGRLLLLCTLRTGGNYADTHALGDVLSELRLHGRLVELALKPLSRAAVADYVSVRSPQLHAEWTSVIHERTEGNPLFMAKLVDAIESDPRPLVDQSPSEQARTLLPVPSSLRTLIEQQLDRLDEPLQHVLLGAAVVGSHFSAALVAAALKHEPELVEQRCEWLAQHGHFIQRTGSCEWPDGTEAAQYQFVHILYQEVFYDRITPSLRAKLHLHVGHRLEEAYLQNSYVIASKLSWHFERGRDSHALLRHLTQASLHALRQCGFQEASALSAKALQLLSSGPATPDRNATELRLRLVLGTAGRSIRNGATLSLESNYDRARELCRKVTDPTLRVAAFWGLVMYHSNYGDQRTARKFGEELLFESQRQEQSIVAVAAHAALAMIHFHLGEFTHAARHARLGLKRYQPEQQSESTLLAGVDLGVQCGSYLALSHWILGERDQALLDLRRYLRNAGASGHPYTEAIAYYRAAKLHQFRQDPKLALEFSHRSTMLAQERGFSVLEAVSQILRGWAMAKSGDTGNGIKQIELGIANYHGQGAKLGRPWHQSLLADALATDGQIHQARQALDVGLEVMTHTGDYAVEAVLQRMKGNLALQDPKRFEEAESGFAQAINVACAQGAKHWEFQAAMQMATLWKLQGKRKQAATLLAQVRSMSIRREPLTKLHAWRME